VPCDDAGGGTDGEQVGLDRGLCYIEDDHYVYSSNLLCGSVTARAVWGCLSKSAAKKEARR
jgi:hypothetical protein